ncbi:MAG: hypothetical protein MJ246_00630 [Clostridia bacterium]|nr:hypothetical protein [Clostridia bacterium]
MFIEKLTDEQINGFLKRMYPDYSFRFYKDEDKIEVSVTNHHSLPDDYSWNEVYYDFDSSRNTRSWVKYLSRLLGQEYKDAYLKDCSRIFD